MDLYGDPQGLIWIMPVRSSRSKETRSRPKTIRILQGTQNKWPLETQISSNYFTLVVDDFGVSYVNKADAEHLKAALKNHYPMTVDWTDNKYIGITFD